MSQLARILIVAGCALAGLGVVLWVGERFGFGKLPGDFVWKRKHVTVYFPIATSLLLSVLLTVLLNLFLRRK
jgi:hypothetical protein